MPVLEANGASFEYVESGEGDPVVFVHGSAGDLRTWHRQLPDLGTQFRTIAYSRRYHWPSDGVPDGMAYAMEEHVDDLKAVLHRCKAAPAHLVGHSYGALVCLELSMRSPDLVRSLVLEEPPAISLFVSVPPAPSELLKLLFRHPRTAMGIVRLGALGFGPAEAAFKRGNREKAIEHFGKTILGREAFENLSAERLQQVRDNFLKEELTDPDVFLPLGADRVQKVEKPVLLIGGTRSPRIFSNLLRHLDALLPRSERVDIPDASHIVHEDNAPAYNRAVRSFLS